MRRSAMAYRLWFIAKAYDQPGCGTIPADAFKGYLARLDISPHTSRRWFDQARMLALIQPRGRYLRLASWQAGIAPLGITHLHRAVKIPVARLVSPGWRAWCWAGFLLQFQERPHASGIIARATLEALSGVPERTQRAYERRAGVINIPNYARFGEIAAIPELAIRAYAQPGYYSKAGQLRRRLPNRREVRGVWLANRGRLVCINTALYPKEDSSQAEVTSSHFSRTPIASAMGEGEEVPDFTTRTPIASASGYGGEVSDFPDRMPIARAMDQNIEHAKSARLYSLHYRQTRKAMRASRNRDGDARSRPGFIYERSRSLPGVGVFDAIPLDPDSS